MVGLFGRVVSPSQDRYLHTVQHKHRIKAHTNIHALRGIRTHDPSVQANEDRSCLIPRNHCDRQLMFHIQEFSVLLNFWTVSIICYSNAMFRFGNWICFRPREKLREGTSYLGPLEGDNPNYCYPSLSTKDLNTSSFRNVVFF
jgi:hypothetical protein